MRYIKIFTVMTVAILVSFLLHAYFTSSVENDSQQKRVINVYTSLPAEIVACLSEEFERTNNVKINFILFSDKEALLNKIRGINEEKVELVLTDSLLLDEAKTDQKLENYVSEQTDLLNDRFKDEHGFWQGVWYDPIVFCINYDYLKLTEQNISGWNDLYKDNKIRIGVVDVMASSAAANLYFTLVSQYGEDDAIKLLQKIHARVVQYSKYLATPVRMAGMREVDLAISVQSEIVRYMQDGFPVKIIYPEEGTSYLLTAVGLLKNADNKYDAKIFIDWLLQDGAQMSLQKNNIFYMPTNQTGLAYKTINIDNVKLLDNKLGNKTDVQNRLMNRWIKEVRLSN